MKFDFDEQQNVAIVDFTFNPNLIKIHGFIQ